MKCGLCGKEVPKSDLGYPSVHQKCSNEFLRELEVLKVIEILSIEGAQVRYRFNDSFAKHLDRTLEDTHFHIITDETVDDDLVTLQGVLRAVVKYLKKSTSEEKIYHCAELAVNSLMGRKYGHPLPMDKKFHSGVKEFFEEVYTMPTDEDTANFLKTLKRWAV